MSLESFIVRRAELKLAPYRKRAETVKAAYAEEYERYLPAIERCYAVATYWHGTGRYHYQYDGDSRYTSVNSGGVFDVLASIVKHDGLTPHKDPWIDSGGKTVSLGTVRMHSKLFARVHQYETNTLLFELGSARYWIQLYGVFAITWVCASFKSVREFMKIIFRCSLYRDMRTYASAIRKPDGARALGLRDIVQGNILYSDIPGNHAVLIGVAKGDLKVIETIPLTHAVEVRSLQPVTLKYFTHIEVPLNAVEETKTFLMNQNISLDVLPIEFVDLYLSTRPLQELAYS